VHRREQALTREQRSNPDSALALWEGLVAGRWSLVDHFDSDGRRFVVARRNDPDSDDPRGLSARERQVAEFVGLGRASKEIAYAFGVSTSAVSNSITRIQAKLGLESRAEVAAFFAPSGLRARLTEFEFAGEPLATASLALLDGELVALLSTAERDVALLALQGATNAAIGAARDTSEQTVAVQLRSIFNKLGVRSRSELAARLASAS
jgi:DNA-binding NarL/FixJ family response regulator